MNDYAFPAWVTNLFFENVLYLYASQKMATYLGSEETQVLPHDSSI